MDDAHGRREEQGFVHSALLYQSQGEFLDFASRFVVDGLAASEPVLIAVPGENLAAARCAASRMRWDTGRVAYGRHH